MRAAWLLVLAACGQKGTLEVQLVTAPGSTLIADTQRVRLTMTAPEATFEAVRTADGIDLELEIDGVDASGQLIVEAFGGNDTLIAVGQTPPFSLAGADALVAIYVAPPYSILEAPKRLLPARSQIAGARILYGAAFAGGLDAAGAPTGTMALYNAYDHSIAYGENLPASRANVAVAANDYAGIYVINGTDAAATPTSTIYRFQSNVSGDGAYVDLGAHPGLESAGQRAVKLGADTFFITGVKPTVMNSGVLAERTDLANVPPTATEAFTSDGAAIAAFVRDDQVVGVDFTSTIGSAALPAVVDRAAIAPLPVAGTVVVLGGATRDAYVITFASESASAHIDALSTIRFAPSVAATPRHIVVAGGVDVAGTPIATADILDATTLALLATVPIVARTNAIALALPNDQVIIVGGDEATEIIELFTPPVLTDPAPR